MVGQAGRTAAFVGRWWSTSLRKSQKTPPGQIHRGTSVPTVPALCAALWLASWGTTHSYCTSRITETNAREMTKHQLLFNLTMNNDKTDPSTQLWELGQRWALVFPVLNRGNHWQCMQYLIGREPLRWVPSQTLRKHDRKSFLSRLQETDQSGT